jgi:hypothetical protein
MFVSKVRADGVFDGLIEFPNGTTKIPPGHSFSLPPDIPDGFYAVMHGGWKLIEGDVPIYPPILSRNNLINILEEDYIKQTQNRLDSFAQTRGYTDIISVCTYITSNVQQFKLEAEDCVRLRDETWTTLFQIFDDLKNSEEDIPKNYGEIEKNLPVLAWTNDR